MNTDPSKSIATTPPVPPKPPTSPPSNPPTHKEGLSIPNSTSVFIPTAADEIAAGTGAVSAYFAGKALEHAEDETAFKANEARDAKYESAIEHLMGDPSKEDVQKSVFKLQVLGESETDILATLENFKVCKPNKLYRVDTDRTVVYIRDLTGPEIAERTQKSVNPVSTSIPSIQETLAGSRMGPLSRASNFMQPPPEFCKSSSTTDTVATATPGVYIEEATTSPPESSDSYPLSPRGAMRGGGNSQNYHLGVASTDPTVQYPQKVAPDRTGSTIFYSLSAVFFLLCAVLYKRRKDYEKDYERERERVISILEESDFLVLLNNYKLKRKNIEETKNILINQFKFSEEISLAILKNL